MKQLGMILISAAIRGKTIPKKRRCSNTSSAIVQPYALSHPENNCDVSVCSRGIVIACLTSVFFSYISFECVKGAEAVDELRTHGGS